MYERAHWNVRSLIGGVDDAGNFIAAFGPWPRGGNLCRLRVGSFRGDNDLVGKIGAWVGNFETGDRKYSLAEPLRPQKLLEIVAHHAGFDVRVRNHRFDEPGLETVDRCDKAVEFLPRDFELELSGHMIGDVCEQVKFIPLESLLDLIEDPLLTRMDFYIVLKQRFGRRDGSPGLMNIDDELAQANRAFERVVEVRWDEVD